MGQSAPWALCPNRKREDDFVNIRTSTGLAVIVSFGLALPAAAQKQATADIDNDEFVTGDEATAHSELRFDEIGEGREIGMEQFNAAMMPLNAGGAEDRTVWDAEAAFNEADSDKSGALSREEWMGWRQQRFNEAAGNEDRIEAGLYKSLDTSGVGAQTKASGEMTSEGDGTGGGTASTGGAEGIDNVAGGDGGSEATVNDGSAGGGGVDDATGSEGGGDTTGGGEVGD